MSHAHAEARKPATKASLFKRHENLAPLSIFLGFILVIVALQLETIAAHWTPLCEQAGLGLVDRALLWGRQILNPFAFYGLEGAAAALAERSRTVRAAI